MEIVMGLWTLARTFGKWFTSGGYRVVLIAAALVSAGLVVHQWTADRANLAASQKALISAQDENAFLVKQAAAGDRAVTDNIGAKTLIQQKETQGLARTQEALRANPDWANQPVPNDVLSSLQP